MPAPLADILILAALVAIGATSIRALLVHVDRLAYASLSLGIGGGLLTWLLFLLSWAGIPLKAPTVVLAIGILLIALGVIAWRPAIGARPEPEPRSQRRRRVSRLITGSVWTAIAILIGTALCLSIGLSYYTWDAIANWSVKGYGIALEESVLGGAAWGSVGLSYPMNLPLLVAVFRILDGDPLPGSKLLFPLLYASLLFGCFRFWIRQGLRSAEASLGTLLLAATPIMFWHATSGYANLAFTFYLCTSILWLIESMQESDGRKALIGGVLLALSVWTRPEGVLMSAGAIAAVIVTRTWSGNRQPRLVPLILPPLLAAVSWAIFSRVNASGDAEAFDLSSRALKGVLAGDIRWTSIGVILKFVGGQLLRFRDWGFTLSLAAILSLVGLPLKDLRRESSKTSLILAIIVLSGVVFGAHYMAAYSPRGPSWVYEWLSLNFNRVFMPVGTLLTLLGFLTLRRKAGDKPIEASPS